MSVVTGVLCADRLYDVSVKRRLHDLRAALLAGVEKHMLGGVERFIRPA